MTNATGAVVSRSSYDVFGERALASAYDVVQPFGFTGREHDSSGLVYARARYLSPGVGRWGRPDPLTAIMGVSGGMVAEPWAGVLAGGMPLPMPGASAYGFVGQSPAIASDPTGLAPVIYTGFGGQAIVTNGTYFGAGAVLGFFSKAPGGPMYSSAIAFTYGLGIGLGNPVQVGIAAEFGIYWDLRPFDDACDYAGPFATAAADLVAVGIGLVWAVEPDKIRAIRDVDSLYAALDWPVGITFSAGISAVPGRAFSFVVSRSHLVQEFNCACRKP
jgi:RHS repeat-associated protein